MKVSFDAAVYLAAVVEYLVLELLDLAGDVAKLVKKKTIKPRYIKLAVVEDEEFNKLLSSVTLPASGTRPNILKALLPKKKKSKDNPT